jgi:serine/threonine protein kinase
MSEPLNRAHVLALLDSLDPARVSPEEIELIRAEEMRKHPALVEEADRLLVRLRELVEALESLPPEEVQRRLAELRAEDPELAARVVSHLPRSHPQPALEPRPALTPDQVRPADPAGYEILEELGRGGMGVVFKARQRTLKRLVALKMILAGSAASETQKTRFHTEAELIARLQHPNIVQVYEVNEHEGLPFFSLELCDQNNLEAHLKEPLLPREAARLVQTLARAIHYAHSLHVIHQDLKPANVLLVRDGGTADGASNSARLAGLSPKITDFGLARLLDEVAPSQTGELAGTPPYMSPEQAGGGKGLGPATDIHALGAILYRCLTGQPPFSGKSLLEILRKVQTEPPAPPRRLNPAVPRDLEAICLRCLKKDPASRYPTADKLAEDLQRFLDNRETLARPLGWPGRLWKGYRRHPVSWSLFFIAVLASLLWGFGLVKTAYAEAERANKEFKDEKERAHNTLVNAAIQFAASGDWLAALPYFAKAIADDVPKDRRRLEVRRLPGLFLYGNSIDTEAELTRLWGLREELDPDDLTRLLLARGEYLISGNDTLPEANALLKQALDTGKLSRADNAYVRGLLTERLTDAIVLFRQAIEIEQAHAGAHHCLLVALLIAGRAEEARKQAVVVRSKFPKDPLPGLVEAFLFLFEGDEVSWRKSIDEIRPLIGDQRHREFIAYLARLHKLYQTMIQSENGKPVGSSLDVMQQVLELNWAGMKRSTPFSFNVPAAKWLGQRLMKFQDVPWSTALVVAAALRSQAPPEWIVNNSLAGMEKLCADCPEPIYSQLLGIVRMSKTMVLLSKGDMKAAVLQQRLAALGLYESAEAPTIAPLSPTRYYSRAFGLLADQALVAQFGEEKDAAVQREVLDARSRMRAQVELLIRQGGRFPAARDKMLTKILPNVLDRDIITPLLLDWEIKENTNPAPGIIRVRMLLKLRNFGAAFDEAGILLQRFPANSTLTTLRDEAQKKITEQYLKPLPPVKAVP